MVAPLRLAGQIAAVALVAALLGLLVWKVAQGSESSLPSAVARGEVKQAPDFTLERLDKPGSLSLASLRGRVVVINFWASWCDPCKKEAPRFQSAFERYRGQDVAFVGVDTTDFSGDARAFLDRYGVTYPNVRDRGEVLKAYGGLPLPRTYVVAPSGDVSGYIFGEAREQDLQQAIEEALAA